MTNSKNKNYQKGFTLMELLVAMFIFVLMMTVSAGVFANAIRAFKRAKMIQADLEGANQAISSMAKYLRTSSVITSDGVVEDIIFFDHSQDVCYNYFLVSADKQLKRKSTQGIFADCDSSASFGDVEVVAENINNLKFNIVQSVADTTVGKVTVFLEIGQGGDVARLQTTVSLRDYEVSGI